MSIVSLLNVTVLNNPAKFMDPYEFEITFECLEPLQDDLEWKLIYVGASKSIKYDQELDSLLVGPVPQGVNRFVFQTDPPNPDLIPQDQLVSITVMLLSCSYRDREFVQVGYYVNNEYDTEELRENPPNRVALDHVSRNILAEKPRVTKYNIPWDSEETEMYPPEQVEGIDEEADEDAYGNEEDDLRDEMIDKLEAGEVEVEGDEDEEDDDEGEDDDDDEDNNEDNNENNAEDNNEEVKGNDNNDNENENDNDNESDIAEEEAEVEEEPVNSTKESTAEPETQKEVNEGDEPASKKVKTDV